MSNIHASKLADLKAYTGRTFIDNNNKECKLIKFHKGKVKVSGIDQNIPESDFRKHYTLVVTSI